MHRRPGRRFRLVCLLMGTFLALHLLGPLPGLLPRAEAAGDPPPLPVPEDPLGSQPEGQHPEISVNVDTRDGHLTVRVVDNWGPGKTPVLYRTYNNTTPKTETSSAGVWQLNQILELRNITENTLQLRDADGSLSTFTRDGMLGPFVYKRDTGTYATIVADAFYGAQGEVHWSGLFTLYLPKGATRKFQGSANVGPPPEWAGITEDRDANGNARTYTWGLPVPGAARTYLLSRTDEIGRVIS